MFTWKKGNKRFVPWMDGWMIDLIPVAHSSNLSPSKTIETETNSINYLEVHGRVLDSFEGDWT